MEIVKLDRVSRVYTSGEHMLKALDDVSISLEEGKFVVILGPSGAGKSTLLNLLGAWTAQRAGKFMCREEIFPRCPRMIWRSIERRRWGLCFSFITWCRH